ncbi:hypothetical protein ABW19_dt0200686 [Dactylella cylindrospora]|nr:hypothetical protein ABW19_dt0200686 [Dactylella cylindrospora]
MPKRKRPSSKDFLSDDVPEVHGQLLDYIFEKNARLSKVRIARLPHGIGIVASERINEGEEVTFIPRSLLLNVHDVPFPNSSPVDHPTFVHSSLAAYVANSKRNGSNPFISILPGYQSFKSSMPMFWHDDVLEQCSAWVISFAKRQQEKLEVDYEHAKKMHAEGPSKMEFSKQEYEWAWAVVNTRTIYYRPKKWYKVPAEDCMTMCPFIDYYNHDSMSEETVC